MKALDTNVLVRFLVRDDRKQAEIVRSTFRQAERTGQTFFVPSLVVLEIVWVLDSVYEISREEIVGALQDLVLMPVLEFEAQSALRKALSVAQTNRIDLDDLLIAHSAKFANCESVLTFDKRASRFALFENLN